MEIQVENAIDIAIDLGSEQNLKSQAVDFLNQLRSEPQGWQVCLLLFTRELRPSETVRHVALEFVNNSIREGRLGSQSLLYVRDNIWSYIQKNYHAGEEYDHADRAVIQSKGIQTITYLFTALYDSGWESFFGDMLGLATSTNASNPDDTDGIVFYFKVLNSVHDEIADIMISRSLEEQQRHNQLKDLVRERDVQAIAQSWQDILGQWRSKDPAVLGLGLAAIDRWVSWVDISLVVNESLLGLLLELVGFAQTDSRSHQADQFRNAALNTFTEIVGKKMKPDDKIELIRVLKLSTVVSELIASPALQEHRSTSDYDTELAEAVAKLVNNTVADVIRVLDTIGVNDYVRRQANELILIFLPLLLRFFSDEYDEICSTVIPSLTDLLAFFRKESRSSENLIPQYAAMLPPILDAVIVKMKYDETTSWGSEDAKTDEAEFQELRKKLHVAQQTIAAVDESLYIERISTVVKTTLETLQNQPGQLNWRDVDLALYEMFLFGTLAVQNGGLYSKTKPVSAAAERLIDMMFKLVESDVSSFSHPAIQLQYMEICVRYSTFFDANPQLIANILENFVRFVHHNHVKVRTRSWYLFHRFVKQVRQHIGNIARTVIQALSDLLPIKAELPEEVSDEDDMSSEENDQSADAIFNNQLHLYEAIGCICGAHAVPNTEQVMCIQSVMDPLFSDLEAHLSPAKTGDERAALQVHHLIMALGTLARGFLDWAPTGPTVSLPTPAKATSNAFARVAEAVIVALETLNSSLEIRTAARFAFSRLVGVLGSQILPQLPRWIDGLLSHTSTKDEMALFLRLLDQIVYEFKTEIFDILNTLLSPLLRKVFTSIAEPIAGTDDEIQLAELKREYLGLLLIILNNELGSVLISAVNQSTFDTVISTIEHFTKDINDFPTAKLSLSVLVKLTQTWGGPDVVSDSTACPPSGPNQTPRPTLSGFDRFMMTRFSPLCWAFPTNPAFNAKDAQARLAIGEAAALQKAIYVKTGADYLIWLRDVELREMGIQGPAAQEYVGALGALDSKGFRKYFQNFVQRSGR